MPLWRMAPSPHGPYWKEGMKLGYQDAGSWTLFNSTPVDRRKAAWLYAQFVVSKTVDVKKSHVGLTIIRDSTINHESFTERAPKLGGLVEFYRSPDRVAWTPTGINVPDYPKLAQLWWQQIGDVNSGAFTPQEAMDRLAGEMDDIMARMQAADEANNTYGGCGPRLNPEKDPSEWLGKPNGPAAKLDNEKQQGQTIAYEELIKRWTEPSSAKRRQTVLPGRTVWYAPEGFRRERWQPGTETRSQPCRWNSGMSTSASAPTSTSTRPTSSSRTARSTSSSARRSPARRR